MCLCRSVTGVLSDECVCLCVNTSALSECVGKKDEEWERERGRDGKEERYWHSSHLFSRNNEVKCWWDSDHLESCSIISNHHTVSSQNHPATLKKELLFVTSPSYISTTAACSSQTDARSSAAVAISGCERSLFRNKQTTMAAFCLWVRALNYSLSVCLHFLQGTTCKWLYPTRL